jgi:hypothetical protein
MMIFLYLACPGLAVCGYMLFRNHRVYLYQVKQTNRAYRKGLADIERGCYQGANPYYDLIPDYDHMMKRFWVWPLSRFGGLDVPTTRGYGLTNSHVREGS